MTTDIVSPTADVAQEHHSGHPGDKQYILIAFALAVVTAVEVAIYYLKSSSATSAVLLVLMALKFAVVAGYFMHLKCDSPLLRRLFAGGLFLAVTIYTIVLFIFGAFHV